MSKVLPNGDKTTNHQGHCADLPANSFDRARTTRNPLSYRRLHEPGEFAFIHLFLQIKNPGEAT
jgi:hypothetical protein